jgi:phenylalanyl-tRNA synthetase beta chain
MRVPVSWLREYVELPSDLAADALAEALIRVGHEVEEIDRVGAGISGVVVGEVREVRELTEFRKPVRFCTVVVGTEGPSHGIVCGATNVSPGARVPVALPGATLPGGFTISTRETYGHTSEGMICSAAELGVGEDHSGILVLPPEAPLGQDITAYLGLPDDVLDISVTPDRGYCLSIRGVAREAAAALGLAFRDPGALELPFAAGTGGTADDGAVPVRIEEPDGCDRYVARLLEGLDATAAAPPWLQRAVSLAGMRPISLAVDVTNYVMLGLGQPLHAFDADRLSGGIAVRRAVAGERLVTLDGVDRTLDPDDLVIADERGPVALAGVMGGAATEISPTTTRVVLESAHFDPIAVTRTARRHGIPSEASRRFERGVDPLLSAVAAETAVDLLARLGGARVSRAVTDVGHPRLPTPIRIHAGLPSRVVGVQYPESTVRRRWEQVGCTVTPAGGDELDVIPASWRPDLTDPFDLIEEVARLEGYDAIPAVLPSTPAGGGGLTAAQRRERAVSRALAAAGYVEIAPYPFLDEDAFDTLGLEPDDPRRAALRLANPLSEEMSLVRTTLLPGLLAALVRNAGRGSGGSADRAGTASLALFEVGQVALPGSTADLPSAPRPDVSDRPGPDELAALQAALPSQPTHVAAVLTGDRDPAGWWGEGRAAGWADAVQAAREVAAAAGVTGAVEVRQAELAPWHPGRCAALVMVAGDGSEHVVGHAGELHPRVVAALELPRRTCAMELDLSALLAEPATPVGAPEVSTYPPATLDVALVVPGEVPAEHVATALTAGAGSLLESLRLFDVFSGSQVGEGNKSLAYALTLRAPDRTLTNEEALAVRDAAVAEAERRTSARLRS